MNKQRLKKAFRQTYGWITGVTIGVALSLLFSENPIKTFQVQIIVQPILYSIILFITYKIQR